MERFANDGYYVKLSTGATYELYGALISLADRRPNDADLRALTKFLAGRRAPKERSGFGFPLAPVPAEIASDQRLRLLAELLGEFAVELCRDEPDKDLCEISWDRELRMRWLAFVLDLRQMVLETESLAADDVGLELPLSHTDQVRCEFERTLWRRTVLIRSTRRRESPGAPLDNGSLDRLDPVGALHIIDRLIDLCTNLPPRDPARRLLAGLHSDRGDVLAAQGESALAAAALRNSATHESDEELREALLEYAETLEEES